VDVAVEAVGISQTFQMATEIVRPGGRVANVGVHGTSVDLQLQNLWIHNIAITMGLVNSNTTPLLLKLVASGKLNVDNFATHHFKLHDMMDAYDTFSRAAETKALKSSSTVEPRFTSGRGNSGRCTFGPLCHAAVAVLSAGPGRGILNEYAKHIGCDNEGPSEAVISSPNLELAELEALFLIKPLEVVPAFCGCCRG
jgi:Zinc-binding dehydrogenase